MTEFHILEAKGEMKEKKEVIYQFTAWIKMAAENWSLDVAMEDVGNIGEMSLIDPWRQNLVGHGFLENLEIKELRLQRDMIPRLSLSG